MYAWVPEILRGRNVPASLVHTYQQLDTWAGKRGFHYCSQREIAAKIGYSQSSVERAVRRLLALGLIQVERARHGQDVYCYTVLLRQGGRHVPDTTTARAVTDDGTSAISPYTDQRTQKKITTQRDIPRDHGELEQVIRRA